VAEEFYVVPVILTKREYEKWRRESILTGPGRVGSEFVRAEKLGMAPNPYRWKQVPASVRRIWDRVQVIPE
jgi:hypothetical protein